MVDPIASLLPHCATIPLSDPRPPAHPFSYAVVMDGMLSCFKNQGVVLATCFLERVYAVEPIAGDPRGLRVERNDTEDIVLRVTDASERDSWIAMLRSETGTPSCCAKGARMTANDE